MNELQINVCQSYDLIMHDLNNLSLWSEATGLKCNFSKCFIFHCCKNNPRLIARNPVFMAHVFVAYVKSILEYAYQLWSPSRSPVQLIKRVERVQRMFTKCFRCIANLSNDERLNYFGLQRLEARRLYLDLLFLYKLKFNYLHFTMEDFNINLSHQEYILLVSLTS